MIEITGKHNSAVVYTDKLDPETKTQIATIPVKFQSAPHGAGRTCSWTEAKPSLYARRVLKTNARNLYNHG